MPMLDGAPMTAIARAIFRNLVHRLGGRYRAVQASAAAPRSPLARRRYRLPPAVAPAAPLRSSRAPTRTPALFARGSLRLPASRAALASPGKSSRVRPRNGDVPL